MPDRCAQLQAARAWSAAVHEPRPLCSVLATLLWRQLHAVHPQFWLQIAGNRQSDCLRKADAVGLRARQTGWLLEAAGCEGRKSCPAIQFRRAEECVVA